MSIKCYTGNVKASSKINMGDYVYFDRSNLPKKIDYYKYEGEFVIAPSEGNLSFQYIDGKFSHHQKTYRIQSDQYLTKFLYYILKKNQCKIESLGNGTTVKRYNMNLYNAINFPYIDKNTQQYIIDIIEPFEKYMDFLLSIKSISEKIIKLIYKTSKSNKYSRINELINVIKTKENKNFSNVLDLSSIESNSLYNISFKKIADFNTNIFFVNEDSLYISTIRPNLEKYGITWTKSNILGTILYFEGRIENKLNVLSLFCQSEFKNYMTACANGTKMPILDKNKLLNYEIKILCNYEIDALKMIHLNLKKIMNKIIITKNMIEKMIEKFIN